MMMVRSLGILRPVSVCALAMSSRRPDDDELMVLAEILGRNEVRQVGARPLGWSAMLIRSFSVSTPARQNISVGGCMPPFSLPFSQGTPAR